MNIAIIGAGNVGTALATSLTNAGHTVAISATDQEHVRAAAEKSGATAATDNAAAARDADVVILAVPFVAAGEAVAADIAPVVAGKIVIDATNPIATDYQGLATSDISGAETFQRQLPGAKVVKTFNTLFASRLAQPEAGLDAFIAADDEEAASTVSTLVDSLGFHPLYVGPLSLARYLEGMAFLNIAMNSANGWGWVSAWKLEQ